VSEDIRPLSELPADWAILLAEVEADPPFVVAAPVSDGIPDGTLDERFALPAPLAHFMATEWMGTPSRLAELEVAVQRRILAAWNISPGALPPAGG
jgi:hypothetical protein